MVNLLISGPEGKIEAKYTHNNNNKSPIVLILHPDPARGGTMNTKIIFRLYKIFINNEKKPNADSLENLNLIICLKCFLKKMSKVCPN